ncbi:MAG: hypothetical protein LC749_11235 [Actinobacteria bacterium]|nr:hypothetical protein [Actinomycetota bacterium]
MTALWQCAVCETINQGGRSCTACGASLTRRSAAATAVRSRLVPLPPPPTATAPLPEPVRRAINREPINETEWPYDEASFNLVPWWPEGHRPRGRFGFWGPVPYYSTRTRRGSEVSVGGCGCCLPIPLLAVLGAGWALWRRLR